MAKDDQAPLPEPEDVEGIDPTEDMFAGAEEEAEGELPELDDAGETPEAEEPEGEKPEAEAAEEPDAEADEALVLEALKAVNPKAYEAVMAAKKAEEEAAEKAEQPETPGFDAELEAVEAQVHVESVRDQLESQASQIESTYHGKMATYNQVLQRVNELHARRQQGDEIDAVEWMDARAEQRSLKQELDAMRKAHESVVNDIGRLGRYNREVETYSPLKPYRALYCKLRADNLLPDHMPFRERIAAMNRMLASQGRPMIGQTRTGQKQKAAEIKDKLKKLAGPALSTGKGGNGRAAGVGKMAGKRVAEPDDPSLRQWIAKYK
jgi:hypothetical protein